MCVCGSGRSSEYNCKYNISCLTCQIDHWRSLYTSHSVIEAHKEGFLGGWCWYDVTFKTSQSTRLLLTTVVTSNYSCVAAWCLVSSSAVSSWVSINYLVVPGMQVSQSVCPAGLNIWTIIQYFTQFGFSGYTELQMREILCGQVITGTTQ